MAKITIQCRLVASEETRKNLWQLMAKKNTPLINEILLRIKQHSEFPEWRSKRRLPKNFLTQQLKDLKQDPRFAGQPSRFYASINKLISYIFKSWFKVQQKLQRKIDGNLNWLKMLEADYVLLHEFDDSLEELQHKAKEVLSELDHTVSNKSLRDSLFRKYDQTNDLQIKNAIVYLLKNGCKIPAQENKEETKNDFEQLKRKVEIKIDRLRKQIDSRIPTGRDLDNEKWLETLMIASQTAPQDQDEMNSWFASLQKNSKPIPYPIRYETNEDLTWIYNEQKRLCIRFSGLKKYIFKIYCDRRQLKWFKRFYEDQQLKKASKNNLSSALFTLRSAMILWKQSERKKGLPWEQNQLYLHCTLETDCWTTEGTEKIAVKKQEEVSQIINNLKSKNNLTENQEAFLKRKNSTLNRLQNKFPRPQKKRYQEKSNIYLGVALGLKIPATIAIVDIDTNKAIAYRNIKQLLKDDYHLIGKRRKEKQKLNHQRHKLGKKSQLKQQGESNLGEYLDRLIAKSIIDVAQKYQVSTIIIPKLSNIRQITENELRLKAEQKIPECKQAQKKYAQRYRVQIHQWSYRRLLDNISAIAFKTDISIKEAKLSTQGKLIDKAFNLVVNRDKKDPN